VRSRRSYDVIVVGGGHNGLVAAAYLARAGLAVLLLERRSEVGGLCSTSELFPGIRGNVAANSAHNLEPKVIADLELERHGLIWSEAIEPSSFIMFPGGRRLVSWPDEQDARVEFDQFASGDYDGYRRLLGELMELGHVLDVSYFGPPPAFADVAARSKTRAQEELFSRVMFGSAAELVSHYVASEELRTSLVMLAVGGNFSGPCEPGSAYQLAQRALYRGSSVVRSRGTIRATADFHSRAPIGGMGAITQAMAGSFLAAGGSIRTDAEVVSVRVGKRGVDGVVLSSGDELDARAVATAINPKKTVMELLPADAVDPALRQAFEALEMDGAMAKVYLALNGLPIFACARSVSENAALVKCGFRIGSTVDAMQRAYEAARQGDWSSDQMIYGLIQTAFDPTLAAPDRHLMSLSVSYAPYRIGDRDWAIDGDPWAANVIRALAEHIVNLDDILEDYRFLTTAQLESEFGLVGGHALHGNLSVARAFQWRPTAGFSDYRGPVAGLYLCSNGSWPAQFVSGLAGHNAAAEILADLQANRRGDSHATPTGLTELELTNAIFDPQGIG
jgi:phytoene dehydrogenase-like protein